MVASLGRPRLVPPVFCFRSGLGVTTPPTKPPGLPKLGSYCLKATCVVEDAQGCPVGKVTGYDKSPEIGRDTERACRAHVGGAYVCGEASVVLLPNLEGMECSGQMFFTFDGHTKKIV